MVGCNTCLVPRVGLGCISNISKTLQNSGMVAVSVDSPRYQFYSRNYGLIETNAAVDWKLVCYMSWHGKNNILCHSFIDFACQSIRQQPLFCNFCLKVLEIFTIVWQNHGYGILFTLLCPAAPLRYLENNLCCSCSAM